MGREWESGRDGGVLYRCNHDSRVQVRGALDLCPMQTIQYLTEIGCESGEHLRPRAAHGHQTHARLCIRRRFGVEDEGDGIDLRLPPTGQIISVAGAFAVVADDNRRFETHRRGGVAVLMC